MVNQERGISKAIIMAAGQGTGMLPLTQNTPKPMLRLFGKPLITYALDSLPENITEVVIVIGYLGEQIKEFLGDRWGRLNISYVVQKELQGTYHAISICRDFFQENEKFLVVFADDIHDKKDLEKCLAAPGLSMLVKETFEPHRFGIIELGPDGSVVSFTEKPLDIYMGLAATGAMVLSPEIFKYPPAFRNEKNKNEQFLTDSIALMISAGHKFYPINSQYWVPISNPGDIQIAEKILENLKNAYGKFNKNNL